MIPSPTQTTDLMLFDTFGGTKRPLELSTPGACKLYCCGPTVYDMSHIGHARAYLIPDVLVRFLRTQGIDVTYVRNITDVDDKIIKRAAETGHTPAEIATQFTDEYRRDMSDLRMLEPTSEPRVTDHLPQILDMISTLIDRGHAYVVEGDVYFHVSSFPAYGGLGKRPLDELRAGARVEVDPRKKDPADFALWKATRPGEISWPSPWGAGRPGWHIECSAMSTCHLGTTFDIHAGGRDLVFPHHENEIAQAQGVFGPGSYARHWLHNGFVTIAGEKMAKSLGNFFTIREVTHRYPAEALRYFLLGTHYRNPINIDVTVACPGCGASLDADAQLRSTCGACAGPLSAEIVRRALVFPAIEEADARVAYVYESLANLADVLGTAPTPSLKEPTDGIPEPIAGMRERFFATMKDDLNVAQGLGELSSPLSEVNRLCAARKRTEQELRVLHQFAADFAVIAGILGVFEQPPHAYLAERRDLLAKRRQIDIHYVESLIVARREARERKDFGRADEIRDELARMGVRLKDAQGQTTWLL